MELKLTSIRCNKICLSHYFPSKPQNLQSARAHEGIERTDGKNRMIQFDISGPGNKKWSRYSGDRRTVNILFSRWFVAALTDLMLQQSGLIRKGRALPGRVGCMSKWCCAWLMRVPARVKPPSICTQALESNRIKGTTKKKRMSTTSVDCFCWVTHERQSDAV